MHRVLPALMYLAIPAAVLAAPILPPSFDDVAVIDGLSEPVAVRFAASGEIFVAEKAGLVKLFSPLPIPGPGTTVLDLRDQVMSFQDRGLLGLALHPRYPAVPYVFVLYTYDAPPGGVAQVWGDHCDNSNSIGGGCVVSGRLVRYTMASGLTGPVLVDPVVLIQDDWYQQYPSHSIGDLAFGPDGMLYVSGGDGASYDFVDIGDASQINRSYPNPGDPLRDGGALRSQDLLASADPLGMNGAVLRVDPDTGKAAPGNPLPGIRQIAFGLRNPFRIGFRPGTRELWIGDVGENSWEEVNRIADVSDGVVENFGWPCYEGPSTHAGYADQPSCAALIAGTATPGTRTPPFFTYAHGDAPGSDLSPGGCQNGNSQAVSGIAFYAGTTYPSQYQHALFFADYAVNCIYAMRAGAGGVPDPNQIDVLERGADLPVSLEVGPGGDLFYTSISGAIRRITYGPGVMARAAADITNGEPPLTVQFDGSGSRDPAGGTLAYAWDLDGDGAFDDSTDVRPQRTYAQGVYPVRVQVRSSSGLSATSAPIVITAGERPVVTITAPAPGMPWRAGERIHFAGQATDPQDGALPAGALKWRIVLLHCPLGGCHPHPFESFEGVSEGSFVTAPDGFPAYYDLELTATDASGFTGKATVRIDAIGTELALETRPPGLPLLYAGNPILTPERVTAVAGYEVSLEAPSPQDRDGAHYVFTGWSDGGDRAHAVAVPEEAHTYIATYGIDRDGDGVADGDSFSDSTFGCASTGASHPGGGALVLVGFVLFVRLRLRSRPRPGAATR